MEKQYDIVVIGGGPAGITAAIYAVRAGYSVAILDKNGMGGGQILNTYEIENYPGYSKISGFDLGMKMEAHSKELGVVVEAVEVSGIEAGEQIILKTEDGMITAKGIVIATGANHRKLNVPGENALAGMGVSYCATCDGAFFRDKEVAVIGGGDVAVEDAIFLARNCKKVYVIHRREEFRAAKILQDQLLALDNVEFVYNSVVKSINGKDHVDSITVSNVIEETEKTISVSGVFVAVGMEPNSKLFVDVVNQDKQGYIVANEDCKTNVKNIVVAGDVRTKPLRQVVTAVADGANAITSLQHLLL